MPYLTTKDNVNLYYKDWGQGRPVIMAHGWPLSADSFDDLSMAIADNGMRAISYDRRGFGRSDQPKGGYDYDTLANDMASVIDATGANDVTLLGFSMGGGEVARYMSRFQAKNVKQAILISSILPYLLKTNDNPDGVDPDVFTTMAAGIKEDRAKFWPGFFKDFFGISLISHPVSDEVVAAACMTSMSAGLLPTLACANAFSSTDFRPDLAAFKVPTLIIHGEADKTVPIDASSRRTAPGIPHAKFIEYDGAPHGLLASHKDRLNDDIVSFLRTM